MSNIPENIGNSLILLVEDTEFNLRFIINILNKSGFTNIATAANGQEALEKTRTLHPDIVLLDLIMPVMDGFQYCETIRKDSHFSTMPIIVQTASDSRNDKLRALSCGADDFVRKPLDPDELPLRMCIHLERAHMINEMKRMCDYLSMELEHAQKFISQLQAPSEDKKVIYELGRHCEVLETLAFLHREYASRG